jgi:hypothetical protein
MSVVECVWACRPDDAGTLLRAVYEITGIRAIDSTPEATSLASCVCPMTENAVGTPLSAVYPIVGIRPMANVPAVTSLAWRRIVPVRPATLCTGARLETVVLGYDEMRNCPSAVLTVIPLPGAIWNVPNADVAVPGTVMNPAGPMPPEATTLAPVDAATLTLAADWLATLTLTAVWPTTLTVTDITAPLR